MTTPAKGYHEKLGNQKTNNWKKISNLPGKTHSYSSFYISTAVPRESDRLKQYL